MQSIMDYEENGSSSSNDDGALYVYDYESDYDKFCDRFENEHPDLLEKIRASHAADELIESVLTESTKQEDNAEASKTLNTDTIDTEDATTTAATLTTSATASPAKSGKKGRKKKKKTKQQKANGKQNEEASSSTATVEKRGRGRPPGKRVWEDLDAAQQDDTDSIFVKQRQTHKMAFQPLPSKTTLKIFGNRRSVLTEKQHELYNSNFLHFKKTGSFQSKTHGSEFKRWSEQLKDEHISYNEILKEHVKTKFQSVFKPRLNVSNKNFVEQAFQNKKSHFESLPNKFELIGDIAIDVTSNLSSHLPILEFSKVITKPVKVDRYIIPDLTKASYLTPPTLSAEHMELIHDDTHVNELEEYAPDFVMSCSSAITLLSLLGPTGCKEWQIPVVVRAKVLGPGKQKKYVYISKPYPPVKLNKYQYKWYWAKCAMKSTFMRDSSKTTASVRNVHSAEQQGTSSKITKIEESVKNLSKSCKKSVQYSLWNLKQHTVIIRSNVYGSLKWNSDKKYKKIQTYVPASLLPKIEYLWEFGAEELSFDETLRHWWTNNLKQSDVHATVRIHPSSNCVLAIEELEGERYRKLDKLKPEVQTAIGQGMIRMGQIFEKLVELDVGNYLICSKENDEALKLYRSTIDETKCDLDLSVVNDGHLIIKDEPIDFDSFWLPIDPDVHLQWHRIKKRIPATFEPKSDDGKGNTNAKRSRKKKSDKANDSQQSSQFDET